MAQPAEIVALGEEMAALYRRTQVEVIQEFIRIAGMPEQRHYRRKLINQSRELQQHLDQVDAAARVWLQERFPLAYRYGQREADRITGHRSTWTQVHREAVREIAQDTYGNLLEATRYVREDTKRFIRLAVREQSRSVVIAGTRTASAAGRYDLARKLQDHGINAVRYKNGAKHTLQTYGEMVVRTQTAMAHNMGVLNGAYAGGTRWMECSDGYGCGLTFHEDTDAPAGTVQPIEVAMAYPLSHPNCARSWSPRPDITDPAGAKAAQRLPDEQLARLAELERERAKVKTVTGRLTGRERMRRRTEARSARLASRRTSTPRKPVPAPPRVPPGLTAKEAGKWIEERWPRSLTFHARGMADDVGHEVVSALDDLMRRYPDVAREISHVGDSVSVTKAIDAVSVGRARPMPKRSLAEASRVSSIDSSVIRFNTKELADRAKLAASEETGFLARGTVDGVVRHEFGHVWHNTRFTTKDGPLAGFTTPEAEAVIRRTIEEFATPDLSGARSLQGIRDVLSQYAATNEKELLAEAFSDVMVARSTGGKATPFAEALVSRLDALIKVTP